MADKNRNSFRVVALASGFFGATASCFAKFAFDPNSVIALGARNAWAAGNATAEQRDGITASLLLELLARACCLLLMIACNAIMLGSFVQGMKESGSIAGTALSSAANFGSSALYGYILLGEHFSVQWWCGFAMVILGVILLSSIPVHEKKD